MASWFNPRVRRRLQIAVYAIMIAVAVSLVGILALIVVFKAQFSTSDRLAAINDVLAGGALLLALTAALITLQAQAGASGIPRFAVQLWLGEAARREMIVVAAPGPAGMLHAT